MFMFLKTLLGANLITQIADLFFALFLQFWVNPHNISKSKSPRDICN